MKKRLMSGMRPTGQLHIGHYIGVLPNWITLQSEYDCYFSVADWHALTTKSEDTNTLKMNTRETILDWFASGLDAEQSTVFVQSAVPEIAELHLIFSMITPLNWAERNPTVKEQVKELHLENSMSYGHLGYPVLQTADILSVKGELVPIGQDQLPHLEFSRDIARRFNSLYGEVFPEPKPKLAEFPLLPGLDGRKMSKSYGNDIKLVDAPEMVQQKMMTAITDPGRKRRNDPGNPDVCTVFTYYKAFASEQTAEIRERCQTADIGCVDCKKRMAQNLNTYLAPIQERRQGLVGDPDKLERIIRHGNQKARKAVAAVMTEVRDVMQINDWGISS